MALKAARDWARHTYPQIEAPEMVVPVTAHPAWNKAAHYLDIKISMTPVKDDLRADAAAMKNAITKNTIILGGTAVTYPHGMVDPIEEIGALAEKKNLWLHVDACLGGLMLPFLKRLGHEIPPYDFSIPGVTSISADIHKYAYIIRPKGFLPLCTATAIFANSRSLLTRIGPGAFTQPPAWPAPAPAAPWRPHGR
jgi:glutamate/tyrosine decarboxylase-like PLP-dependent enzyme